MTVFMSPIKKLAVHVNGERIVFSGGYFYCENSNLAEDLKSNKYYGVHFVTEAEYPLRFGDQEKSPTLLKNALIAADMKRKHSEAKLDNLSSENARLQAELKQLKEGKNVGTVTSATKPRTKTGSKGGRTKKSGS